MDYMTLKEASEKWGLNTSVDKLLLLCRTYSRCCKDGNGLADTQSAQKLRMKKGK